MRHADRISSPVTQYNRPLYTRVVPGAKCYKMVLNRGSSNYPPLLVPYCRTMYRYAQLVHGLIALCGQQHHVNILEAMVADFAEAWSSSVRQATVERLELLVTFYVACVHIILTEMLMNPLTDDSFVWGCLQALPSNAVSKYLGLTCSIAAIIIIAVVYMEVCRKGIPPDCLKGFVWIRVQSTFIFHKSN